jgi:hypothetical protein
MRTLFLMPPAKSAGGKVHGALPRTPARGTPPETPARFPSRSRFQNGPRCQGFATPRKKRAPLTAPGRSEKSPGKMESAQVESSAAVSGLPLVGHELLNRFGVDKTS